MRHTLCFWLGRKTDNDILPAEKIFDSAGIITIYDEAVSINRKNKSVQLKNGEEIIYDKLVIGTGSLPTKPGWLKGVDLKNVFTVPKNKIYLDEMQSKLNACHKVVTIGAGFIGVEMSDELNKAGKDVTLIEKLPTYSWIGF